MGETANATKRGKRQDARAHETPAAVAEVLLPVCDTVSGQKASENPVATLRHYEDLAHQLWLPPRIRSLTDELLAGVGSGRVRWASLSGPYGFGKTAAAITAWQHARSEGYLAIPPLSCSSYDELARGVAAIARALRPDAATRIERLFRSVWEQGIDEAVRADADRYELPTRTVRRMLQDKVHSGQLSLDGSCHRLVQFLSELAALATTGGRSKGLVVILDELQQLLGPLDTRSVIQFREFVWGLRTEQSPCGVLVCLDAMLEARLARWAADLLHRVRESGPTVQLVEVYTRQFPHWLWTACTTANGAPARCDGRAIAPEVLTSLEQFVERPDLANGPRTVVDVFCRAVAHYHQQGRPYGIADLVTDLRQGVFRYFGEGAPVQRVLAELLGDDWVSGDADRAAFVQTLAAFPRGCPANIAASALRSPADIGRLRSELFGPLLVELPDGLALERLQQVRRAVAHWEHVLGRCWDTLPALDSLLAHSPDMFARVFLPRLFPESPGSAAHWERLGDAVGSGDGWRFLRGSFDDAYPARDVGLWIGREPPNRWPEEADLAIALLCAEEGEPTVEFTAGASPRIVLRLPLLRVLEFVPPEVERFRKYLQPEPFRPATLLAALHELEAVIGRQSEDEEAAPELSAFMEVTAGFLLREVLQGRVDAGLRTPIRQRGLELLRALYALACRARFPDYRTLQTHHAWRGTLEEYRRALRSEILSDGQRRGQEDVTLPKSQAMRELFGQKSVAASDSLLRLLGPLAVTGGTAEAFTLRFGLHPGECRVLDYLRSTGRRRAVPRTAVHEALRHVGYLPAESDALLDLLTERRLVLATDAGFRLVQAKEDRAEREQVQAEIQDLLRRLRRLGEPEAVIPDEGAALAALWSARDELAHSVGAAIDQAVGEIEARRTRTFELAGTVRAETIPDAWSPSDVATHLGGVGKLLARSKESLARSLAKSSKRLETEAERAAKDREGWAVSWQQRREGARREWRELDERVQEFLGKSASLQAWLPLNERIASLAAMGQRVASSDPTIARSVAALVADLREQLATDHWQPLEAHEDTATALGEIEAQAHGLFVSQIRAYLTELDALRSRFGDFLSGPAPQSDPSDEAPPFRQLYLWASRQFEAAAQRLRGHRERGAAWRHPTRKSQGWTDLNGQVSRALGVLAAAPGLAAALRVGELLGLMRLGFFVAAAESGQAVYEGEDGAAALGEVERLLSEGRVRVRVEWLPDDREAKDA